MLLMGMGLLWVYAGCYRRGWRLGGSGSVGIPIFSLRLGLSFGSALNFCCGYLSLIVVFFFLDNFWVCVLISEFVSLCSCCSCSKHT